jgi:CRISPR-associated endoribonuclease Cas6
VVRDRRNDLPGGGDVVYSFSNLFPPGDVLPGDRRRLLIASPNPELVRALARRLRQEPVSFSVRGMQYRVESHDTFSVRIDRSGLHLVTATPILIRVTSPEGRGRVFWAPPMPEELFVAALNRDLVHRFNRYHATRMDETQRLIESGTLSRATRSGTTPSSYWEFRVGRLNAPARRILAFSIDAGFGERTGRGFGFINVMRDRADPDAR